MSTAAVQILTSQQLKEAALQAWAADKDLYARSEESAASLGAALIKVEKSLPYGEYGSWLKASGINRNRASYCVRLVNGKDAAYQASKAQDAKKKAASHFTDLKLGMRLGWDGRVFRLKSVALEEGDQYLVLNVEPAPLLAEQEPEPTPVVAPESPYEGPPKVEFDVAELNKALKRLGEIATVDPLYSTVRIAGTQLELMGRELITLRIAIQKARAYGDFKCNIHHSILSAAVKPLTGTVTLWEDGTLESGNYSTKLATFNQELRSIPVEEAVERLDGIDLAMFKKQSSWSSSAYLQRTVSLYALPFLLNPQPRPGAWSPRTILGLPSPTLKHRRVPRADSSFPIRYLTLFTE